MSDYWEHGSTFVARGYGTEELDQAVSFCFAHDAWGIYQQYPVYEWQMLDAAFMGWSIGELTDSHLVEILFTKLNYLNVEGMCMFQFLTGTF